MSKHTPGPWIKVGGLVKSLGSLEKRIADVKVTDEEGHANASLISAAPDLLAILERLKIEIILSDVDPAYIKSHFQPWLDKAAAAIEKAYR